jgi:Legionella pneumophila major outer membrane protein precursor
MPSIQLSMRGTLLTSASAFALSISGYSAEAQFVLPANNAPSQWTVWAEGASFQTGGGGMNVPSLPGLNAPFMTVGPRGGLEGAAGFDYNWAGPWHAIFDFRYGRSRTATSTSSSSSSSSFHSTVGFTFFSSQKSSSNSQTAWERESHLVADFMVGRDYGLGTTTGQLQFGIRLADLSAKTWAQQSATTSSSFFSTYFGTLLGSGSTSSTETATGAFNSRFFGVGPRLAVTGSIPIQVAWSIDYEAGVAGLIGDRSFNYAVTVTPGPSFSGSNNSNVIVFNADGWAGLSYALTSQLKMTGGIRADYYADALTTYNFAGGFTNVDRLYWGPFLRLTGKF